jgi:hypothetical protein
MITRDFGEAKVKVCPKCTQTFLEEEIQGAFNKNHYRKDGLDVYCKGCRKNEYLERKFKVKR